jgi:hypothetical protein
MHRHRKVDDAVRNLEERVEAMWRSATISPSRKRKKVQIGRSGGNPIAVTTGIWLKSRNK